MEALLSALKALAEPTRMRVMALCAQGDLTVSELVTLLGQSQPRVSRHLKLLCEAGLLQRLREGSWVFHRLPTDPDGLAYRLIDLIPYEDEVIARDLDRLKAIKAERAAKAAAYFDQNAKEWNAIRALHVPDALVEDTLLERLALTGQENLLDVGTGTGRILEVLGPKVQQGWGVDLSSEMLSIARSTLAAQGVTNCAVRQGDMYQIPFGNEAFDLLTIHQVLHYSDEPARALEEAARVLRPHGVLALIDFAPHDEENLRENHQHRRLGFSDAEIETLCADHDLQIESIDHLAGNPLTVTLWIARKAAQKS